MDHAKIDLRVIERGRGRGRDSIWIRIGTIGGLLCMR